MLELFKRFILSLSSFAPGVVLYLFTLNIFQNVEKLWFSLIKISFLILILVGISAFALYFVKQSKNDDNIQISSIQPVENELIPTYLGLFVIMIGLGNLNLLYQITILMILFIIWWLLMERSYYFNLLWLFAYRYYRVSDNNGNVYIIYSKKKDCKSPTQFDYLIRLNNFTFLEGKNRN